MDADVTVWTEPRTTNPVPPDATETITGNGACARLHDGGTTVANGCFRTDLFICGNRARGLGFLGGRCVDQAIRMRAGASVPGHATGPKHNATPVAPMGGSERGVSVGWRGADGRQTPFTPTAVDTQNLRSPIGTRLLEYHLLAANLTPRTPPGASASIAEGRQGARQSVIMTAQGQPDQCTKAGRGPVVRCPESAPNKTPNLRPEDTPTSPSVNPSPVSRMAAATLGPIGPPVKRHLGITSPAPGRSGPQSRRPNSNRGRSPHAGPR